MSSVIQALLLKEWIKLRIPLLASLLFLGYAVIDTGLNLKQMVDSAGHYGLVLQLITKPEMFFNAFHYIVIVAGLLAFCQVWPEARGKTLRLFFHMPQAPEKILAFILVVGLCLLFIINLLAVALLAGVMHYFHLPVELIRACVLTYLEWAILSFCLYCALWALLSTKNWHLRVIAIIGGLFAYDLMQVRGYQMSVNSYPEYLLVFACLLLLAICSTMRFNADANPRLSYRISRIGALVIVVFAGLYKLPAITEELLGAETTRAFVQYSPVREEFVIRLTLPESESQMDGSRTTLYQTSKGDSLTEKEFKQSVPFLYYRDLLKWGLYPEKIQGQSFPSETLSQRWGFYQFWPREWHAPALDLYIMLESEPSGSKFTYPNDIMRLSNDRSGLEFFNPVTAEVNELKSFEFTEALRHVGVTFPLVHLSNNADIKQKEYDNGFILSDSSHQLFQLQMVNGKPKATNLNIILDKPIVGLRINEDRIRKIFAFVTTDTALYVLLDNGKKLQQLPIPDYQVAKTQGKIFVDPLGVNLSYSHISLRESDSIWYDLRLDNHFIKQDSYQYQTREHELQKMKRDERFMSTIFPFVVAQGDQVRSGKFLRVLRLNSWQAVLLINGICVALLLVWTGIRRERVCVYGIVLTACFGIIALIASLILNRRAAISA